MDTRAKARAEKTWEDIENSDHLRAQLARA
jgi:hypothetical protein